MRVFKRMSDNSTVHIKYNASSHEIFMWGEYSLVKEAKRTMERRFDYLCDNIERITKMNKKRKEDAGRTITRKSDIRRTEKAERFGLVAMDDLRKLPENQTSHRGVFMLPRSDVLPIARLLGPNGKPLDDLRHDLGCRIVFGEREAQEGIIKVAGNSYELVREVLSRLTIHVAKRTYPRPPPVQERLFDVTEKPMEITTERVTANYIPWDLPQDNAWHTSPTVLKGILSGDMFNSSRLTESRSSLEATLTRNIQRFVRFIGLHDGNAKMRICLGTCLVSDISPKLHDLSQKIALKEIFVTQNALMYFSRNLLQSNHQVELLTSRLPSNYRRVDDDYSVGYSFRCEHRSSSASYSPKTAWPNIKLRVWFSREGRASRWEAVIGERRELDLNVIYPNNDYYNKPDWRLEATTWFHSPIKPDSEIGRLVTRMRINERGRLEYSNTDQLVVQQITCKTRILYESADDFQLEITRAQVWNCDPDTDGRDTPTPLLAKSTFESYGATIWPLLWKRLLEDNSHTSIGCVPNYSEGDFFTGNYISKLVDSVHTVQNTLGSVLH
ncbi:hypothetical protein BDF19DRAFT_231436 [Syncephalis fuscata]|nr:hypothetical protein BDF19DRAFT_231436 [Syncephalis fuscata]